MLKRPLQAARTLARHGLQRAASRFGPQRRTSRSPRLWILMYHRILPAEQAAAEGEEPGMYVTPETFANHLRWVRECLHVVRLGEWVQRVQTGEIVPANACAITFDDGWRDNVEHALPLLVESNTPATVFAVSHMVGTTGQFWPNRLSRLLDQRGEAVLSDPAWGWLQQLAASLPGGLRSALTSAEARSALIHRCKQLSDALLNQRLDELERRPPALPPPPRSLMNWEELRTMMDTGLVEIGSHSCHHYRLGPELSTEITQREIIASQKRLEAELGRPIPLFCYPNGDYTASAAVQVAKHYQAAVTTQRGINTADTPMNRLLRIGLHENATSHYHAFMARLSGWRV